MHANSHIIPQMRTNSNTLEIQRYLNSLDQPLSLKNCSSEKKG